MSYLPFIFFVVGIILALFLFLLDCLLYVFWLHPFEQISIQAQDLFKHRQYFSLIRFLVSRRHNLTKLIFHSAIFMLIWPFLSIFILTSTSSIAGLGLMLGLGGGITLSIILDWHDYRQLHRWLGWQIKRELSETEVRFFSGGFIIAYLIFLLVLIF